MATSKTESPGPNTTSLQANLDLHRMPRRTLLHRFVHWSVNISLAVLTLGFFRFFFPRVLFEPPTRFTIGTPDEFQAGTVSTKYQKEHRIWVAKTDELIYVLLARCTHLGCTPRWLVSENKFKCPCHGSGFTREGVNFEGPAPRPLERLGISVQSDGRIAVDKGKVFRKERGQWEKKDSFVSLG